MYDLPQYAENVQIIRYDVLIPKENKDIVHHLVVHLCERSFLQTPDTFYGAECGAVPPPGDIGACLGSGVVIAWVFVNLNHLFEFFWKFFCKDLCKNLLRNKKKITVFEF